MDRLFNGNGFDGYTRDEVADKIIDLASSDDCDIYDIKDMIVVLANMLKNNI